MNQMSIQALRSFSGVGAVDLSAPETALVLIDMQRDYVGPGGFTVDRLRERGLEEAAQEYEDQVATAIANQVRLLASARKRGQHVFHVRTVSRPGRQSGGLKIPNQWFDDDAPGSGIIAELAPAKRESVVTKSCSGAFVGTNLEFLFRRFGITSLVFAGVVTDGCVEQAVRQAHDLGFSCVLVSDACAALTKEIHDNALERLEHRRAHVVDTERALRSEPIAETTVATAHGPARVTLP